MDKFVMLIISIVGFIVGVCMFEYVIKPATTPCPPVQPYVQTIDSLKTVINQQQITIETILKYNKTNKKHE